MDKAHEEKYELLLKRTAEYLDLEVSDIRNTAFFYYEHLTAALKLAQADPDKIKRLESLISKNKTPVSSWLLEEERPVRAISACLLTGTRVLRILFMKRKDQIDKLCGNTDLNFEEASALMKIIASWSYESFAAKISDLPVDKKSISRLGKYLLFAFVIIMLLAWIMRSGCL